MAFGKEWQKGWWEGSRFFKTLNTNHLFYTLIEKHMSLDLLYELQSSIWIDLKLYVPRIFQLPAGLRTRGLHNSGFTFKRYCREYVLLTVYKVATPDHYITVNHNSSIRFKKYVYCIFLTLILPVPVAARSKA
jgi:hypothetical protein